MKLVKIKKGTYRNQLFEDEIFVVASPFRKTPKRSGIKVIANESFGDLNGQSVQIMCGAQDFVYLDEDGNELENSLPVQAMATPVTAPEKITKEMSAIDDYLSNETEEEAMDRIRTTFRMQHEMVSAVNNGVVRGLILYGPPGIGKTHGVMEVLGHGGNVRYLKGADMSKLGLYQELWNNRKDGNIVVLDDCDSILYDESNLLLLKSALDSGSERILSYPYESKVLEREKIDNEFEFKGSVIFMTNVDLESLRESRLKSHIEAILSRCHYLDLSIHTLGDKILRIKQVLRDGMLEPYEFDFAQTLELITYIIDNAEHLREVSLRMVKKIADIMKASPTGWKQLAEASCMRKEARFRRLIEEKKNRSVDSVTS